MSALVESRPRRLRRIAGIAFAATLIGGTVAATSQAANAVTSAYVGDGFTIYSSSAKTSPTYTIRFASTSVRDTTKPYLDSAIAEIHARTNTRISFNPTVGADTSVPNEIFINSGTNSPCGSTGWDGCGGHRLSNNVVVNGFITFRLAAFSKATAYLHAMVAHELGHSLGLMHHSSTASLMHWDVGSEDYVSGVAYKTGDLNGFRYLARYTPAPAPPTKGMPGQSRISTTTTTDIYYVDSSDRIANAYVKDGSWHTAPIGGQVRADSPIVSPARHRIFFIDRYNRLANAYQTNGTWYVTTVGNNVAKAGSGLASPNDSYVYYVNADGKLATTYYSGGRWNTGVIGGAPRAGTPLHSPKQGQIYFFDTSNRLSNAWYTTQWNVYHIGGQARAGSGLTSPDGTNVYFVDPSHRIVNAWHTAGVGWKMGPMGGAVRAGSPLDSPVAGRVFYFDTVNRLANAYVSNGSWAFNSVAGTGRAGSGLDAPGGDAKNVYFAETGGALAHAWYSTGWRWGAIGGTPR